MSVRSSNELRSAFLEYFRERGHEVVPSSPLVPANDPTLLFTNAGMVQFKDVFLGLETRPYRRAVTAQRCVRAGGKHNDLENVGYTARHHTFFEMLGNFSFGDYFKREAIHYAWEFLTGVLRLPPERLWVTVYEEDDEAARIWLEEVKVDPARFSRIGDKPGGRRYESDNFWAMGDTGPCGPCSEIFYDHGPEVPGGPPGSPDEDGDRYVEIWNLVFMQYNRDAEGNLEPLPAPSVDTGMGLERVAAVLQGVHSNYEIDLFRRLMAEAARLAGCGEADNPSLRVIADHIRACAFLVADGVMPSNEGRGYVLRRIIRRAIRHGYKLGLREPFFHRLVEPLCEEMGEAYPVLPERRGQVERVLRLEEERFAETLEQGMRLFEQAVEGLSGTVIPGETVFRLYDTYGFPVDLTADMARERGLTLDMDGFEREMAAQRERARAASRFAVDYTRLAAVRAETRFTGYERLVDRGRVVAVLRGGEPVEALEAGEEGSVVLDRTPFYAESGGQVGDRGELVAEGVRFAVRDTQKAGAAHAHVGRLEQGRLAVGDEVEARVDAAARQATALNHSATHLLHAALRRVLGAHVVQKGSLVAPDRLRFDFSHFEPVSQAQLLQIERLVNAQIRANAEVVAEEMAYDEAVGAGAMALFGEKYGDRVRVLRIGDFSLELCGGTHVRRAGDIGLFKIVSETGVAAGVRRIEALTGEAALRHIEEEERRLLGIARLLKGGVEDVEGRVQALLERGRALERELERLKARLASGQGRDLAAEAREVAGVKVVAARLDGADVKALRSAVDQLKARLGSGVVVLAAVEGDDKVRLVAGVTRDLAERLPAGELMAEVAARVGGRGGGRADMAQGGGSDPARLDEALEAVAGWVQGRLGGAG
ncbi:alanine--tRNA ligase [Inmirania thermothiophila]|uniref:Alanine--tRNA ligase n=1 Tax=Inmirania thermothiophila TaxID=1750597 RepID=A0A3N1XY39_9GAMM|nr:alanine--tRNA ligase [Inmirania thermothiophila]ROR29847.1 alanyl-tRNA synthetase [Inmirania thermothiophila]